MKSGAQVVMFASEARTQGPIAKPKRPRPRPWSPSSSLRLVLVPEVPLPRTLGDCRQPPVQLEDGTWAGGACPKLACQFHLGVHVWRRLSVETIGIGSHGGTGRKGISLALRRNSKGTVETEKLEDAIADAVVEMCDTLPSVCVIDYVDNPDLMPPRTKTKRRRVTLEEDRQMTLDQVGGVMMQTRERVRQIEAVALAKMREGIRAANVVPVERLMRR